jgi:hypothetical protein
VLILGAGAAGLMCAIEAGKRGRSVVVLERNKVVGEKIRISGGGRCNFTNLHTSPANFISNNPHFAKSALAQYSQQDYIALVEKHKISYHEKTLGQLFCDGSAQQIIDMLLKECHEANVRLITDCHFIVVRKDTQFDISTSKGEFLTSALVVATGGKSLPKLGASSFGYQLAEQFGLKLVLAKPGLVPLTLSGNNLEKFGHLSGISMPAIVSCNGMSFRENILFTQRGLSGPAILQISSYWNGGEEIEINLLPDGSVSEFLTSARASNQSLGNFLGTKLPKRFVKLLLTWVDTALPMSQFSNSELETIAAQLSCWRILPAGTEGYLKAEVTVGGVDTNELSSKTMAAKKVPGLYFIGEVVDVTGWLGGYNFQWAWSSGVVAGRNA